MRRCRCRRVRSRPGRGAVSHPVPPGSNLCRDDNLAPRWRCLGACDGETGATVSGRGEEFDCFVRAQAARLHRLAYLLCGDWHLAHDLVQEALVKCFHHWRRVQHSDTPDAYVRRILVNEANRHWKRNRHAAVAAEPTEAQGHATDDSSLVVERAALVHTLMALPKGQRAVVVLRHLEDLSEHDTARILGCSVGTVKSQNVRALKTLRVLVQRQEIMP